MRETDIFCKVFTKGDRQALILKKESDQYEGKFSVELITVIDGIQFKESYDGLEEKTLDFHIEEFTEERATRFLEETSNKELLLAAMVEKHLHNFQSIE